MPAYLARVSAIITSPRHRRAILVIAVFLLLSAVAAAALFPGRLHLVVFTTVVWSTLFGASYFHGYGPLAINAALLFWLVAYADDLNYDTIRARHVLAYVCLIMATYGLVVIAHQVLSGRMRLVPLIGTYLVSVFVALTALVYVSHNLVFGAPVSPPVLYAIYQTHSAEVLAFLTEFGDGRQIAAALIAVTVPAFLVLRQHMTPVKRVSVLPLAVLVFIPIAIAGFYRERLRVLDDVVSSALTYRRELAIFRELQAQRLAGGLPISASKETRGETYVIVIGESLNRNQMRLYGYHRNTTPTLDSLYRAGELLRFTNAHSTHTHTVSVLPSALTAANQRNGSAFLESPSVLDVARAAGIETLWITNQPLYGPWDNLVSILAQGADQVISLNRSVGTTSETLRYDDAAVPALERILEVPAEQNRLIVVHLMGSHWRYCERYPEEFRRFTGSRLDPGEFGWVREGYLAENINCYDNSVLFNDHVVSRLLHATRRIGGVAGFIYLADHGEDVMGGHGHHSERFTYQMVEIPLVAWFSNDYQRLYGDKVSALRARSDDIFPTDFFFDAVLGIVGIATTYYDQHADLSGTAYRTSDVELRLLDGKRRWDDAGNVRYHQRTNVGRLASMGLLSRVLPHRVNSTGMLAEVLFDGHRALEVDLLYRERDNRGFFEIGHDDEHASGNHLAAVLALMPIDSMRKLWLDVKNLNRGNVDAIRAELARLGAAFDLKPRVIFESPAVEQLLAIGRDGFHTSYYLPTDLIVRLSEKRAFDSLRIEASRIARRAGQARVAAVSFDVRLYPFVKEYLEPLIGSDLVYHTWELDLSLADPDFLEKLAATAFFRDPRVETILVEYRSELLL